MEAPSTSGRPDPGAAPPSVLSLGPNTVSPSPHPPLLPLPSHFPPPPPQSILGRPPNPSAGLYAAGRGYPPRRSSSAGRGYVTVANPAGYIRNNNPTAVVPFPPGPGFHSDYGVQMYHHHQRMQRQQKNASYHGRPTYPPPQAPISASQLARPKNPGVAGAGAIPPPDFPPPSAPPSSSKVSTIPAEAAKQELKDRTMDDGTILVYDRKVRLLDIPSGNLYGLCRSWLHNGVQQDNQDFKFRDSGQLLPKPLPQRTEESVPLEDEIEDDDESGEAIDRISASDLLQRHVKRAKRVKARLNKERAQKIARFRQRLSLLLPVPSDSERSPS